MPRPAARPAPRPAPRPAARPAPVAAAPAPEAETPSGSEVLLRRVPIAFPHVFEPSTFDDGKSQFNLIAIIEPNSENARLLEEAIQVAAEAKYGSAVAGIMKKIESEGKICLRKYPKTDKSGNVYQGFEDMWYVSANSDGRPTVFDRKKSPITAADGLIYGGAICNVMVNVWAQNNKWGQRINAGLMGLQFYDHGDAFGGQRTANPDQFPDEQLDNGDEASDLTS